MKIWRGEIIMINKRMFKNNEQEGYADFAPGMEDTVIGGAILLGADIIANVVVNTVKNTTGVK